MKHILIPTDFTVQSLNAIHAVMATYPDARLRITLFHLLRMPSDISDMLFPSMRNKHLSLVSQDFKEMCEILLNRYNSHIDKLNVRFGYGSTVAYLQNFLEGEKVDGILICPDIQLCLPSPRSLEMQSILKRTGYPIDVVPAKVKKNTDLGTSMKTEKEIKIPKGEERYAVEK